MPQATRRFTGLTALAMVLTTPLAALAQTAPAGIVTALQGRATVVRTATRESAPLKFKDDVFLHDRIRTGEHALVRLLLGGRATVTVREQCVLTITDQPNASQVHLGAGRASVAAVKSRMKPGQTIDIVTPHAQATIRGTVVITEVAGNESTFTVIRGLVDVSALDPTTRYPAGRVFHLGPLQQVTVSVTGIARSNTLTPAEARNLAQQFTAGPREAPIAAHAAVGDTYVRAALDDLAAATGGRPGARAEMNRGDEVPGGAAAVVAPGTTSSQPGGPAPAGTPAAAGASAPVAAVVSTTTSGVGSVATTATNAVAPLTNAVAPVVTTVTSAVAPLVTTTVAPVVSASTNLVAPVLTTTVNPVVTAVAPLVAPLVTTTTTLVAPVVTPVATAVTPVVSPVVTTVAPVVTPVTSVVPAVAPVVTPVTSAVPVLGPLVSPPTPQPAPTPAPTAQPPASTTTPGLLGKLTGGLLGK